MNREGRLLLRVLGIQFLILMAGAVLTGLTGNITLPFTRDETVTVLDDSLTFYKVIRAIFWVVIVASLWEEAVFRGIPLFLHTRSVPKPVVIGAVVVGSLLWSFLHLHALWLTVAFFLIGLTYAQLCFTTRSLWPSVKAHAIWNSGVLVASIFLILTS